MVVAVEGCLQTILKVLFAHPRDGRLTHLHSICNLLIYLARSLRALVGFEQDPDVSELAGGGCARGNQAFQLNSFSVTQDNGVLFLHNGQTYPLYP